MAASKASIAASKLLNLRSPALPALLRRHLLHPSAAASPAHSLNFFHSEDESPDNSSIERSPIFHASIPPLNLQLPLGYPVVQIEAARKSSTPEEDDDDLEDDDDIFEDFDVDDDDVDMENFSGSEFDVEGSDEEVEDRRPRPK